MYLFCINLANVSDSVPFLYKKDILFCAYFVLILYPQNVLFLYFFSVWVSSQPDKKYKLLHFMWTFRECAAHHLTWQDYDEQFRMRQAIMINTTSWTTINNDLWWRCVQVKSNESVERKISKFRNTCNQLNEGVFATELTANSCICVLNAAYHIQLHFAIFIQNIKSKL